MDVCLYFWKRTSPDSEMEPLPLVPKNLDGSNHDSTHILREAFQDLLSESTFPENVGKSMEKYNVRTVALKENAMISNFVRQKLCVNQADIEQVERELMDRQAEYFITINAVINNDATRERIKLRRSRIIRELPEAHVHKYGLLDCEDLLPSLPERAIDFRINSNRHLCNGPCEPAQDERLSQLLETEQTSSYRTRTKDLVIFEATPKQIVFDDYELNVTYVKRIKLRNITKTTHVVALKHLPKTKYFTLELETTNRVAAGMCAIYAVKYNTDIYHDIKAETVTFNTYSGDDVTVTLKSHRSSPCLRIYILRTKNVVSNNFKFDSLSDEFFDIDRTMALNTSIDCGSTLIGDEIVLSIIMKNEGGFGKFFFLTEADWFGNDVRHISDDIELHVGPFRLYPAYFQMNENEFSEVVLSFFPRRYGLYVETVYLLCNNNTYEELDIMGDGIYLEKSCISFDLKKKDSKPFFLDYESEYCLHLGKCLICTKHDGFIRVTNNSPLNLRYRWTLRHSENPNSTDFKHIAPHWITIKRMASLPPHTTVDFDLEFYPETTLAGLYRIVFCLYVENIPEISLRRREEFTVLERDGDDGQMKLLDVLMGEIEVLCEVEKIDVFIEPNPLVVPFNLLMHMVCKDAVTITSGTLFPLECEWVAHKSNSKVIIEPEKFELTSEPFRCTVSINGTDIEDIEEQFLLFVNDGVFKAHFKVAGRMMIPQVTLSIATIDFGHVMENFVYKRRFRVENKSKETVRWKVNEDIVALQEDCVLAVENTKNVFPNNGCLHPGQCCVVEYTACTQEPREWLSYLKLYTDLRDDDEADFVCGVHYTVGKPETLVHTNTSELPIFFVEEIQHIGVPVACTICLHNSGNIVLIFACGKPTGISAPDFDITITPAIGIVNVREHLRIDVKITPKAMGYFEDVYVPIFTLGCDKVTLVKLMCLVGDITVNIYLPNDDREYTCAILWPKVYPEVPEFMPLGEYPVAYEFEDHGEDEAVGFFEGSVEADESLPSQKEGAEYSSTKIVEYYRRPEFVHEEEEEDAVKLLYQLKTLNAGNIASQSTMDSGEFRVSRVEKSLTLTLESSSSTGSTDTTESYSLKSVFSKQFGSELVLQDYVMEIKAVPLRTPVKRTIKIENLTPGSGDLKAEVTNFYHTEQPPDTVNEILAEMKMAKSTKWDNLIGDNEIVIKVELPRKDIGPHEIVEVDVWVYANTWGYYLEEIVIDISQLIPFCASILIEVVGSPVEFPIAQNSICKEPTLRLGTVPFKSQIIRRRLKVVNVTAIPLHVSWHMFLNLNESKRDFSVIFDMPDSELLGFSEELVKGQLILTNQYFGEANATHFEIDPIFSYIEPKRFVYVEILANIGNFDESCLDRQIEANLLGIVRVAPQFSRQPNIFARPTGLDLPFLRIRITLEIRKHAIFLNDVPDKLQFPAYATDIMEAEVFTFKKTVILKNTNPCANLVYVETEKPFKIVSVKTRNFCTAHLTNCISLPSRECMEVVLECKFTNEEVIKMVDTLENSKEFFPADPDFKDNSLSITKMLNIYESGYLQTRFPLEMRIFYPIFKAMPASIKFGEVYVGDTAKSVVTLKNLRAAPVVYNIYKCNKVKEIVAVPKRGTLPKIGSDEICTLSVFFSPTKVKLYEEWFAVTSTIIHHYVIINVTGAGSYNEIHHKPGLH